MPEQIHHWHTYFGTLDAAHGGTRTLEEHARRNPNGQLDRTTPAEGVHRGKKAIARVSGSCWIADCPTGDGGAEFVNFEEPLFFCCGCRNAKWKGKPLEVVVPDPAERLEIEQVLLKRPDPATRNWSPGEEVSDLKVENLTHGEKP